MIYRYYERALQRDQRALYAALEVDTSRWGLGVDLLTWALNIHVGPFTVFFGYNGDAWPIPSQELPSGIFYICDLCELPIALDEAKRGMGDGTGQRYAHDACYWRWKAGEWSGR